MPYTAPTPADVKLDFPSFTDVDDAAIQRRIDRTASWVDESWFETDYAYARSLLTAHFLTMDGLGTGTDAEMNAAGLSGVTRLKSGQLDVSFSDTAASQASGDDFEATRYGRQWLGLLKKNKGGPIGVSGVGTCGIGPQSTDLPWYWRGI